MTLPARDALHDADQAAEALGIPRERIYSWRRQGLIAPAGYIRSRGRGGATALYYLDEIVPVAEAYLARKRRRHAGPDLAP